MSHDVRRAAALLAAVILPLLAVLPAERRGAAALAVPPARIAPAESALPRPAA